MARSKHLLPRNGRLTWDCSGQSCTKGFNPNAHVARIHLMWSCEGLHHGRHKRECARGPQSNTTKKTRTLPEKNVRRGGRESPCSLLLDQYWINARQAVARVSHVTAAVQASVQGEEAGVVRYLEVASTLGDGRRDTSKGTSEGLKVVGVPGKLVAVAAGVSVTVTVTLAAHLVAVELTAAVVVVAISVMVVDTSIQFPFPASPTAYKLYQGTCRT
jgi:hypothetical protein